MKQEQAVRDGMYVRCKLLYAVRGVATWLEGAAKALVASALVAFVSAAWALEWDDGTYTWSYVENGDGTVKLFKSASESAISPDPTGALEIPSKINGKALNEIGDSAFKACSMTAVTIPDSVTKIGAGAFNGCDFLTEVTIPDNVTTIGEDAFSECYNLTSVEIPAGVTAIGDNAFSSCAGLVTVTLADKGIERFQDIFSGYTDLTVVIADGVTEIPDSAFYGCGDVVSVVIPESVETIAAFAFNNSGLKEVTVPSCTTTIGDNAFADCSDLLYAVVPSIFSADLDKNKIFGYSYTAKVDARNVAIEVVDGVAWSYTASGDEATVGGGAGGHAIAATTTGDIVVPRTLHDGDYTVKSIGAGAFKDCVNLVNVLIPSSVTSIGMKAFEGCSSLEGVVIPKSVKSAADVGNDAFKNCSELAEAVVPAAFEGNIDASVFDGCTWVDINYSDVSVTILDGLAWVYIMDAPGTAKIGGGIGGRAILPSTAGDIVIPKKIGARTVLEIGAGAFEGCGLLTSVEIPDSVEILGNSAFEGCDGLESIEIPDSVTEIGESTFAGCSALESVEIGAGVLSIHPYAFDDCLAIEAFSVAEGNTAYKDDGGLLLTKDGKTLVKGVNVAEAVIPDGVETIGDSAFYALSALESVDIPDSVTKIEDYAFDGCTALWNMTLPSGLTAIGEYAFEDCDSLESVAIPGGVKTIAENAFSYCDGLAYVVIASGVEAIEADAFYDCDGLAEVVIPSTVTDIGVTAFFNTGLTDLIVPDSVTSIAGSAFGNCPYLTHAVLPLSFKDSADLPTIFGSSPCYPNNIEFRDVPVIDGIPWTYVVVDGAAVLGDGAEGLAIPADTVGDIVIPATLGGYPVTGIGDRAFMACYDITSVAIPDSVKTIGSEAFSECGNLAAVTFGSGVETIGDGAFDTCSALTGVTIPDSVTSIGDYAFAGCTLLAGATIGNGVTSIGNYAFSECGSLASVTIGNGVTSIGESAFESCISLAAVTIPGNVKAIGDYAFDGCSSLTDITIDYGVESIGMYAFEDCVALTSVILPDSVTSIGEGAFYDCSGLESVTVGAAVSSIEYGTFMGCSSLANVTLSAGGLMTTIGEDAFSGCTALASVVIPEGVTTIGNGSFSGCTALESVTIPDSVTTIDAYAFAGCDVLESVTIPDGVTTIGECAFSDCVKLADADGFVVIGGILFNYLGSATALTIPEEVTRIDKLAFWDCTGLEEVAFHKQVDLGTDAFAFSGPSPLKTVYAMYGDIDYIKAQFDSSGYDIATLDFKALCTVTFDVNSSGVCAEASRIVPVGEALGELPEVSFEGGKLVGWFTDTDMSEGNEVTKDTIVNGDVTFHAMWALNCTVTFDANGGTCAEPSRIVPEGYAVGELPSAFLEGYTLEGWFTSDEAGEKITADTVVTADMTIYAHWTEVGGGGSGGDGDGEGEGGAPVDPEPEVEPVPCYEFLDITDITEPYSAPSAVLLRGAVYDGCDVVGIMELKLGKEKKGKSKIGGSVTLLNGKKYSIKAQTAPVDGVAPSVGYLPVKSLGMMHVAIGGTKFAGSLGGWHVQSASVCTAWSGKSATASVEMDDVSAFSGMVLTGLLPYSEVADVNNGKWKFKKAAGVKWSKPKKGAVPSEFYDPLSGKDLLVDESKGKTNLSAMKLSYTPKKGTFKGSFKLYALQGEGKGRKLKKYTVKVSGVVVDGVGYGVATCKKPAVSWAVTVK